MTNAAPGVVARDSTYTVKCYVPLSVIFPSFQKIRDAGTIFLSAGQYFKCNIRTVPFG